MPQFVSLDIVECPYDEPSPETGNSRKPKVLADYQPHGWIGKIKGEMDSAVLEVGRASPSRRSHFGSE